MLKMADQLVNSILEQIPSLEANELIELCDHFQVQVEQDKRGNVTVMKREFMKFLTSDEVLQADEGEEKYGEIDVEMAKLLKKRGKKGTPKVKDEDDASGSTSTKASKGKRDPKAKKKKKQVKEESESEEEDSKAQVSESSEQESDVEDETERLKFLRNLKLREFKIVGVVGGSEGCIDYRDLQFQIKNGKTQGYKMSEIRAGVIKAIKSGSSLKRYFEGAANLTDSEFIKMLRSHYKVKDATTIFNKMVESYQEPLELETDFVLRMMDMRNDVINLSKEEDCQYEDTFVRKKFAHAVSVGFADDAVRMELRGVLKDHDIEDHELLEEVSIVMQRESEHKKKLKHKYKEVKASVKEVRDELNGGDGNIKTLATEIKSLALQVAEMMKVVGNVEVYRIEVQKLRKQVDELRQTCWKGKDGFQNKSHRGGHGRGNRGGGHQADGSRGGNVQPDDDDGSGQNTSRNQNGGGGFRGRGGRGGRGGFSGRGGRGGFGGQGRQNNGNNGNNNNPVRHFIKCTNCEENGLYCTHCSLCGEGDHKYRECPLNE